MTYRPPVGFVRRQEGDIMKRLQYMTFGTEKECSEFKRMHPQYKGLPSYSDFWHCWVLWYRA